MCPGNFYIEVYEKIFSTLYSKTNYFCISTILTAETKDPDLKVSNCQHS